MPGGILVKIGIVVTVNVANNTARVEYEEGFISAELQVLSFGRGSGYKPMVTDQVVVASLENGDNIIMGYLPSTDVL